VTKPVLTVVLASADLPAQKGHLARGALFLPEPSPSPEPFAEIVLRVEAPTGKAAELDGRVLQILPGRGIAIAFDDTAKAKEKLLPLFDETGGGDATPTMIFWGRTEIASKRPPVPAPPAPEEPAADSSQSPEPPEPEGDRDESAKLRAELLEMTVAQKMQLALKGDRLARHLLLKEPNKNIQTFILQNNRITLDEVRYIAAYRQASADALLAIAANRDWLANPGIVSALIRNPKTPGATAVKLLDKVKMEEIRRLAKAPDVPRVVQVAARRRVSDTGA
jgi:hypothetical protein